MKKFRFQFERVLEYRAGKLNAEEAKLSALQQRLADLEASLAALRQRRARLKGETAASALLHGSELRALAAHLLQMEKEEKDLLARRSECATLMAKQQNAVLEARRKHRAMEMLEQRRFSEWRYETGREEEKQVSELFLANWIKKVKR